MKAPGDEQVQLWVTPVADTWDHALLERYAGLLNTEETARWQRFLYPADRQSFLIARALVRSVLANLLGSADPAALRFTHNSHGKPGLAAVAGKVPLQFNLSHTDGLVVLAVSRHAELGVDVESVHRKVEMLALSSRFFSNQEHEQLLDLGEKEQRERFFALWTLKEAWLKARGLGLHIPLDDFSFRLAGKTPVISFGPQLDDDPAGWQFRLLNHGGHFRIGLAVQRPAADKLVVQLFEGRPLQDFRQVGGKAVLS